MIALSLEALPYAIGAACLAVACWARPNAELMGMLFLAIPLTLLALMLVGSDPPASVGLGGEFDVRLFVSVRWWMLCGALLLASLRVARHVAAAGERATMVADPTVLVTRLPPRLCAERLRESVDTAWFRFGGRRRPVRGRIGLSSLRLWRQFGGTIALRTVLSASVEPRGDGATIACRWRMSIGDVVFVALWHGLLLLIGGLLTAEGLAQRDRLLFRHNGTLIAGLVVFAITAFGLCLVLLSRRRARADARFLVDFLRDELLADEQPAGG